MKEKLLTALAATTMIISGLEGRGDIREGGGGEHRGGGEHMGGGGHMPMGRGPSGGRNPFSHTPSMSRAMYNRPNFAIGAAERNVGRGGAPRPNANAIQGFLNGNHFEGNRVNRGALNNTNFGNNVRNDFRGSGLNRNNNWFGRNFWNGHNFHPAYWNARRNWWGWGTADNVGNWLGWNGNAPVYYDYGSDGYSYDNGYNNNAPTQTVQTTYVQAPAAPVATGPDTSGGDWMPLGVFALTTKGNEDITPNIYLQLALNRNGTIAGTLYNSTTDATYPVVGTADKGTQVVAWQISGTQNSPIFETGVYNLTQSDTPVQVHFADGSLQVMELVRLQGQEGPAEAT